MGINRPDMGDSYLHARTFYFVSNTSLVGEEQATNAHISLSHITWGGIAIHMLSKGRGLRAFHSGRWRQDICIRFAVDDHDLPVVVGFWRSVGWGRGQGSSCR